MAKMYQLKSNFKNMETGQNYFTEMKFKVINTKQFVNNGNEEQNPLYNRQN